MGLFEIVVAVDKTLSSSLFIITEATEMSRHKEVTSNLLKNYLSMVSALDFECVLQLFIGEIFKFRPVYLIDEPWSCLNVEAKAIS